MNPTSLTKTQAAYVLLAKYDENDPDNFQNREMQKNNYKKLALLLHPDKQDKDQPQNGQYFNFLSAAKIVLGL